MPRKSKIDEAEAGDDVIDLAIRGDSHDSIAVFVSKKHRANINRLDVTRYLERNKEHIVNIVNNKERRTRKDIKFTIDTVKEMIKETADEIQKRLPEFEDDPRALVAFLKLKLEAVDRIAKLIGAYQPDIQVNQQVNIENVTQENIILVCKLYPKALSLMTPKQKEEFEKYRKEVE